MPLVEALVASTVFAVAAGGALQITAATAAGSLSGRARDQALERLEQDRLQLQGQWRRVVTAPLSCQQALAAMEVLAAGLRSPEGVQRQVRRSPDLEALVISWQVSGMPQVQRQRLVSPLGLGLCVPPTSAVAVSAGGLL
jgi:hypothetical protein